MVLGSRDLLERLNHVEPKANYSLQEVTEQLLHYGALLRAHILDTFGNLLYIYYDDFSVQEVEALRRVYRDTFERRYNILHLVRKMLRNPEDLRPSRICAEIYALAEPCLKSSANVCRGIRKRHDLSYPDDLIVHASNTTYLMYRSSKISRHYSEGLSLPALLKLLHRGVLSITPGLLSGLLYHVNYDDYDGDVLLAEQQLILYLNDVARNTRRSFHGILKLMSPRELRKYHSIASFLKSYIDIHVERFGSEKLKMHALLIVKHLVDVGTIDENIYLLGNIYENDTIHVRYLFNLVLPDDVLHDDVIDAKRYLVDKLNELDMVEKYLKVSKYQQATPAQLLMEITWQLQNIGFVEDIATALRIYARFWRRSYMVESLNELLRLFDAYENLRRVPHYRDMMKNLDQIKQSLSDIQEVRIEILCSAPRACLRNGLRMLLDCKLVSPEIKRLIEDLIKQLSPKGAPLDVECLIPMNMLKKVHKTNIQSVDVPKTSLSEEMMIMVGSPEVFSGISEVYDGSEIETKEVETKEMETTTTTMNRRSTAEEENNLGEVTTVSLETYRSEENAKSGEVPDKTTVSEETESSLQESVEFSSMTENTVYETTEPILTTTTTIDDKSESRQEETTIAATTTSATTIDDEEVPNIDMVIESKSMDTTMSDTPDENSDTDATPTSPTPIASKKSCESDECNNERSLEETSEQEDTSTTLLSMENRTTAMTTPTTQGLLSKTAKGARTVLFESSSSQEVSRETTPAMSETLITEGEKCMEPPCSEECAESAESSKCRTGGSSDCGSLIENCDGGENSGPEDTKSERLKNRTAECRAKIICKKEPSPTGCDKPKNQESDERCGKICASREEASSCEDDDCSAVGLPTMNLKFERAWNRSMCEIQDVHHRRQMMRLARMRAISAATSRQDDESVRKRLPRRRDRIATKKKLYQLLEGKLPRNENEKTKSARYSLLAGNSGAMIKMKFEEDSRKKRTIGLRQRDMLRGMLERKRGKSSATRHVYRRSGRISARQSGQTERIPRRGARPIRDGTMAHRDLSM
ncbi:PREDICTED: uncharacterized protein LOC106747227 isoform X1 [Dinoponera quadriceps]|nr:PREDICTED: uncharacterized protein LOC106747227 isoform X1 [Dinoponera quadriceps]XP_014480066.1 PREDICTED: uncharacterized protein LOC106747227 isoform X1 [Dinoponera quadriceps]